jgi:hypothetical protein
VPQLSGAGGSHSHGLESMRDNRQRRLYRIEQAESARPGKVPAG